MNKNDRFGNLVFSGEAERLNGRMYGLFNCDCGAKKSILLKNVERGRSTSCGCNKRNIFGISRNEYKIISQTYYKIKHRCYVETDIGYQTYGGRGIKVCDRWLSDIHVFIKWAINSDWKQGLTIDRIDVNGDYEPNNCKWSTMKEQARNRRSNVVFEHNGESHCIKEWCEIIGIAPHLPYIRYQRGKRNFDELFCQSCRG